MSWRMRISASILAVVFFAAPLAQAQQPAAPVFSDEAVGAAIDKGRAYLLKWLEGAAATTAYNQQNITGQTALAVYALLASQPPGSHLEDTPTVKKVIQWIAAQEENGTYSLGLRCQVWAHLRSSYVVLPNAGGTGGNPAATQPVGISARQMLEHDKKWLIDSMSQPTDANWFTKPFNPNWGSFTYTCTGKAGNGSDHSNTQYGHLGVWAAALAYCEVPPGYWKIVAAHYHATQCADGGWQYGVAAGPTSSETMTVAGLATLFVVVDQDQDLAAAAVKCKLDQNAPPFTDIKKGLDWLDKKYQPQLNGYLMYGIERVGLASGYKYFGNKDWYKLGATLLISKQDAAGSWAGGYGAAVNTSYCLLYLVRGRAPVTINRLEYDGDWNNRPVALANLNRWLGPRTEGEANWQIVNFRTPVEEWHDAPILLISGTKKPNFKAEELASLRSFVNEGGMILSVTEAAGTGFDGAMRGAKGVYSQLFPEYEIKDVPADDPLCATSVANRTPIKGVKLLGIHNGIRWLAIHAPDDILVNWQQNRFGTDKLPAPNFQLPLNMTLNLSESYKPRHRGVTTWIGEPNFAPARKAKAVNVKYKGNWQPEPLAWERFRRLMGQEWQTKLELAEPTTADQLKASDYRIAALTGTAGFTLTDAEKKGLKAFTDGGGTLVIDAAGGSQGFADSAKKLIKELYGDSALVALPLNSPVYNQPGLEFNQPGLDKKPGELMTGFRERNRPKAGQPRLQAVTLNGRVAVIFSPDDLTFALLGIQCVTCVGYYPDTAVQLMRNIVLYGAAASAPAAAALK